MAETIKESLNLKKIKIDKLLSKLVNSGVMTIKKMFSAVLRMTLYPHQQCH